MGRYRPTRRFRYSWSRLQKIFMSDVTSDSNIILLLYMSSKVGWVLTNTAQRRGSVRHERRQGENSPKINNSSWMARTSLTSPSPLAPTSSPSSSSSLSWEGDTGYLQTPCPYRPHRRSHSRLPQESKEEFVPFPNPPFVEGRTTSTKAGTTRQYSPASRSCGCCSEQRLRSRIPLGLGLLLLAERKAFSIAIGVRFVSSKLGFAELIQVFATRIRVIGIVHRHIRGRVTALT
jgi:hypothetical protein